MLKSSTGFSIVDNAGTQEAGCRATLALVVVPLCVQILVVVLILSSSLTAHAAIAAPASGPTDHGTLYNSN